MVRTTASWCFRCPRCGTWASRLDVDINGVTHGALDEDLRETGLSTLRKSNGSTILDRLAAQGLSAGAAVLDVGSAHGWFVLAALARGWEAQGIEPDVAVADRARIDGVPVRHGFFPNVLDAGERFDAISFNDVLEHIPDVSAAVAASHHHLKPGGLLSVNIPTTSGLVFRLATLADRAGVHGLFRRLWQVGFPSPHVWYFDAAGLSALCAAHGLEVVRVERLPSITRGGLWERAHQDRKPSPATIIGVALGWIAAPLLNSAWASDIMHLIARKSE